MATGLEGRRRHPRFSRASTRAHTHTVFCGRLSGFAVPTGDDGTVDGGVVDAVEAPARLRSPGRPPKPGGRPRRESARSDRRVTAAQKDGSGASASPELVDLDAVFGNVP